MAAGDPHTRRRHGRLREGDEDLPPGFPPAPRYPAPSPPAVVPPPVTVTELTGEFTMEHFKIKREGSTMAALLESSWEAYKEGFCSICLQEHMHDAQFDLWPCKHTFCSECSEEILRLDHRCPACRVENRPAEVQRAPPYRGPVPAAAEAEVAGRGDLAEDDVDIELLNSGFGEGHLLGRGQGGRGVDQRRGGTMDATFSACFDTQLDTHEAPAGGQCPACTANLERHPSSGHQCARCRRGREQETLIRLWWSCPMGCDYHVHA